ncbi:hypothetical protein I2I11_10445 [Pontibacter sp. 172403-2]|uniref:hypothetical protein n=1 Tax=Pontibacter rufus TaxID=2791028 RepID=UPI0018AF85A5|nr:hypothetical protein [Pontibacter sp. 172403-2]MBF9253712.1 hypothetical protein [Pontibacter sp. 172403-2]
MEDKVELTSMVTILNQLYKDGYKHNFKVSDDGRLCTLDGQEQFTPEQVRIVNFYRFEGETNPGDEAILYVLETNSGIKGTVSNAYGPYADEKVEAFMKQLEDLGKELDK